MQSPYALSFQHTAIQSSTCIHLVSVVFCISIRVHFGICIHYLICLHVLFFFRLEKYPHNNVSIYKNGLHRENSYILISCVNDSC